MTAPLSLVRRIVRTPEYHCYLLQLENYELGRFWNLLWRKGFLPPALPFRKKIEWTPKLFFLASLTFVLNVFLLWVLPQSASWWAIFLPWAQFFLVLTLGWAFFLTLAVIITRPLDFCIKKILLIRAHRKLARYPNLKIIGIAGSYGKTSAKEVVATVMSTNFKILTTPENINTPLGIARLVLQKLEATTEVLVVEMGEYYRGDIKEICSLVRPHIAVATGINEAHLERFGTLDNTVATIFEVVENSHPNSLVVLNADDQTITREYARYLGGRTAEFYSFANNALCAHTIDDKKFNEDGLGWTFSISKNKNKMGEFTTRLLGEYSLGLAMLGLCVGEKLGISTDKIREGIREVPPIMHRLQPLLNTQTDVLVIDDSYNGNPAGVLEAIQVMARFKNRRKVFITPGLVEMGARAQVVHLAIGKELASMADVIMLIKNSVTPFIAEGLKMSGYPKEIVWYDTAQALHEALARIIKPHDVVVFQNDWGDNYV